MEAYHIHQLERMTGIKAHTIRIWEKRYGLIEPRRTATNRRYYSDDEVRKLLNISTLLAQGQKISKIATFSEAEMTQMIQISAQESGDESVYSSYINDLIKSMLEFDEAAFDKIFSAAALRFGMQVTMINVVYPFLSKVGILWSINKAAPIQEHFAANIIKRKLMSATDGLMPATKKDKKFLLFLPPSEWHEIGLLLANYIIRANGYQTIYLGQDVPAENIGKIVSLTHPTHLLFFYIMTRPKEEVTEQIKMFSKIGTKTQLLVAGNSDLFPDPETKIKNITYLKGAESLINYL